MLRKSSGPLRLCLRLRARRAASLRVRGPSDFFNACISSRDACMNSTSSGSGLRSVLAIASAPRSATRRRRISASISPLNFSIRSWNSSFSRRSSSEVSSSAGFFGGCVHHLLEHVVEVEVPQRAVQVVGAADRSTGLHTGEALHGLLGHGPHHALVAVHQRLHQHLSDLFGRQAVHAAGAVAFTLLLRRPAVRATGRRCRCRRRRLRRSCTRGRAG